jgi:hypothetical protein
MDQFRDFLRRMVSVGDENDLDINWNLSGNKASIIVYNEDGELQGECGIVWLGTTALPDGTNVDLVKVVYDHGFAIFSEPGDVAISLMY